MKQKIHLIGRTTRDAQVRESGNSTFVGFNLAVNGRSNGKETADFYSIAWFFHGTKAKETAKKMAQYLPKGKAVAVDGDLSWGTRSQEVDISKIVNVGGKRVRIKFTEAVEVPELRVAATDVTFLPDGKGVGETVAVDLDDANDADVIDAEVVADGEETETETETADTEADESKTEFSDDPF